MTAAMAEPALEHAPARPYLAPVPDSEPPFDADDTAWTATGSATRLRRAGSIAIAPTPPAGVPAPVETGGPRRSVAEPISPTRRAAHVLATALVEMLSGRRSVGQLRTHCTPATFVEIADHAPKGPGAPAQLMSVRVCQPADDIGEVSAIVRVDRRVHAIAFRIEHVDGRWQITALAFG